MKRPGHSRAPHLTAKQRRALLAYAQLRRETMPGHPVDPGHVGMSGSSFLSDHFHAGDFIGDIEGCARLAESLAYDGTDGP